MVQGVNRILILDCGSQVTQLIARRIREASVYCEIHPAERGKDVAFVKRFDPRGVILSGGPNSVFEAGAPAGGPAIPALGPPVRAASFVRAGRSGCPRRAPRRSTQQSSIWAHRCWGSATACS